LKYQNVADGLVSRLEACVQMNPKVLRTAAIEAAERQDPYEVLSRCIKHLRYTIPEDKTVGLELIVKLHKFSATAAHRRGYLQKTRITQS
jgi:hypothetical protein